MKVLVVGAGITGSMTAALLRRQWSQHQHHVPLQSAPPPPLIQCHTTQHKTGICTVELVGPTGTAYETPAQFWMDGWTVAFVAAAAAAAAVYCMIPRRRKVLGGVLNDRCFFSHRKICSPSRSITFYSTSPASRSLTHAPTPLPWIWQDLGVGAGELRRRAFWSVPPHPGWPGRRHGGVGNYTRHHELQAPKSPHRF